MVERLARLYAERSLNDRLYAQGLIPEGWYAAAKEGIELEIDRLAAAASRAADMADRGAMDGFDGGTAASG